ncbi:hypothetical protein [Chryseobacterium sp. ISL-6]|uniref:hypothetical protein n=1 Tax=Chryseobacterium sp. ISL-6 TaxID=2819143 RepID=UPI001BE67463|nr:hypothetical protein [Chryseobacterium sp. ISL-6]MBT2621931.1 hypothetical protein [Chryseobacterium sp. ISL-6]
MKTLKTAIAALLIAGGTIGAFAFTKANTEKVNDKKADLYWFSPGGSYLGQRSQSTQQTQCGTPGSNICAQGYSAIDLDDNGNPQPEGSVVSQTTKN